MTEFQVISALVLVAFGTKRPRREEDGEAEDEDDDDDDDDDGGGRSKCPARRRGRSSSGGGRSRSLFHSWALLLVASAGLIRVAWVLLRSGGWERGVGGVGGFGGSGSDSSDGSAPGWISSGGGSSSGVLGSEEPSLVNKFKIVFSRGVFTP